jgi:hypothetical protein
VSAPDHPGSDSFGILFRRAQEARARAVREVERSHLLGELLQDWRVALVRRCAWCDRLFLGGAWVGEAELPALGVWAHPQHTHTICPDCLRRAPQPQ